MRRPRPAALRTVGVAVGVAGCLAACFAAAYVVASLATDRDRARERFEAEEGGGPTGAAAAQEMRYLQRSSGRGSIPPGALVAAMEKIEEMQSRQRDAGLWTWEWLGPGNIGGRIRTILTHPTDPNRLWLGGASGGIWKTTNAGVSWTPIDDFLPSLTVTGLVMDPTNPNTLYASTGEGSFGGGQENATGSPGAGVFRSTDGGTTWTTLPATSGWKYVNRIAHHPSVSGRIYACTRSPNGVWYTEDGGNTWDQVLSTDRMPTDVEIHPTLPWIVLVGCSYGSAGSGGAYRATDGVTFTDLSTGGPNELPNTGGRVELCANNGGAIYAVIDRNGGEVYRSTNTGAPGSWTHQSTQDIYGSVGGYANALWVDPTNANRLLWGGVDTFRSTTAGVNWTRISSGDGWAAGTSAHPDQHVWVEHTDFNGLSNRTVYSGNDGGIYRISDFTTATTASGWTELNNGLGITQFYHGAASTTGSRILGGTQDNGVPYLTGGGSDGWNPTTLYTDAGWCAIDPSNSAIVYSESQYGGVKKSTDGGASWTPINGDLSDSGDPSRTAFIAPLVLDPDNSQRLFHGSDRIWRTTNAGTDWSPVRDTIPGNPYVTALAVRPGNSNEVWAGYQDGTVARSTNGGGTWTNVDANGATPLPNRWVMDIAASPYFANEAIVVFAGYETDNVWLTVNGGTSWLQRTGTPPDDLPALQVNTVCYHPTNPDWIYIGTDLGVFASEDFGVNWNVTPRYTNNEGPGYVEVDELFFYQDRLVAATWGRGMYRSRPLDIVYVDIANLGSENGTFANPYDTVVEGIAAQGNGTALSIQTGTYIEGSNTFDRRGLVSATGGTVTVR